MCLRATLAASALVMTLFYYKSHLFPTSTFVTPPFEFKSISYTHLSIFLKVFASVTEKTNTIPLARL